MKAVIPSLVAIALLMLGIACGGATTEESAPAAADTPAPAQDATTPASQPAAAAATVVATATPRPTNTPTAAQDVTSVAARLRIASIPPVQQLVGGWLGTTTAANTQVRPFTDPLVHTDRFDGSLVPGLATSWEANDDGTTWTFHLRDDV